MSRWWGRGAPFLATALLVPALGQPGDRGASFPALELLGVMSTPVQAASAALDHVILAINDLEKGIAEFAAVTGVTPIVGGEHPGRGTRNALVSLGEGAYLEILAPGAGITNPDSIIPYRSLTVGGWALRPARLDQALEALRAGGLGPVGPQAGSRRKPDGGLLEWRTGGARGPGLGLAPFLIEWSPASAHPSSTSPAGCRLLGIEVRERDPEPLRKYLEAVGYSVAVTAGDPGLVVRLACPRGTVSFGTME